MYEEKTAYHHPGRGQDDRFGVHPHSTREELIRYKGEIDVESLWSIQPEIKN